MARSASRQALAQEVGALGARLGVGDHAGHHPRSPSPGPRPGSDGSDAPPRRRCERGRRRRPARRAWRPRRPRARSRSEPPPGRPCRPGPPSPSRRRSRRAPPPPRGRRRAKRLLAVGARRPQVGDAHQAPAGAPAIARVHGLLLLRRELDLGAALVQLLHVHARLVAVVDRGDHHAGPAGVEQGHAARLAAGHLAVGVVADQRGVGDASRRCAAPRRSFARRAGGGLLQPVAELDEAPPGAWRRGPPGQLRPSRARSAGPRAGAAAAAS